MAAEEVDQLHGVDIDAGAIEWLAARHDGRFSVSSPAPPLAFEPGSFDVVLAISVFSHMDEATQLSWLAELSRILRPEGLLIASTHGRDLLATRGDLSTDEIRRLSENGFLFAPGGGAFNDDSAFHELAYLERAWAPWFQIELFEARGLMGYQDLSAWKNVDRQERAPAGLG